MGTSVERTRAHSRGAFAESLVGFLFHLKGYRIVAQRCRSPAGKSTSWRRKSSVSCSWRSSGARRSIILPGPCPQSRNGVSCGHRNTASRAIRTSPPTRSPSTWCWQHLGPDRSISRTHFPFDLAPLRRELLAALSYLRQDTNGSQSRLSDGPNRSHRYQG